MLKNCLQDAIDCDKEGGERQEGGGLDHGALLAELDVAMEANVKEELRLMASSEVSGRALDETSTSSLVLKVSKSQLSLLSEPQSDLRPLVRLPAASASEPSRAVDDRHAFHCATLRASYSTL